MAKGHGAIQTNLSQPQIIENTGGGDRRCFKEGGYEVRGCFSEVILD